VQHAQSCKISSSILPSIYHVASSTATSSGREHDLYTNAAPPTTIAAATAQSGALIAPAPDLAVAEGLIVEDIEDVFEEEVIIAEDIAGRLGVSVSSV